MQIKECKNGLVQKIKLPALFDRKERTAYLDCVLNENIREQCEVEDGDKWEQAKKAILVEPLTV